MKKAALLVAGIIVISFLAYGCAQKAVVSDTASASQEGTSERTSAQQVTAGSTEGDLDIQSEEVDTTDIASSMNLEAAGLSDIYFEFDSYEIQSEYKDKLLALANKLLDTGASVLIEGHCDDRGTNEYNLALGDRRAKAAKDFLKAAGVPASRIETISFGEEKPICTQQAESCWSQNRRAHFKAEGGM